VLPDLLLDGRYRLEEELARGGTATVWRARDLRLDRPVAVKVLRTTGPDAPTMLERLRREARAVARLTHPNIVGVHDVAVDGACAYLVMELVEGRSLAAELTNGPLPVGRAVAIAAQISDVLAAAHAVGVIHRDVKPANIMLTPAGTVKVVDFGIARLPAAGQSNLTGTFQVVGTSLYMAPELARGAPADARSDLYALGCLLYAMLTGAPPFTGDDPLAVLHRHLHQPPVPVRAHRVDVPAELERLVGELLDKDPAHRPADAGLVRARLAKQTEQRYPAAAAGPLPRTRAPALDRPTLVMPGIAEPADAEHSSAPRTLLDRFGPRRIAALVLVTTLLALAPPALLAYTGRSHATAASQSPTATPPPHAAQSVAPPADEVAAVRALAEQQVRTGQLDPKAANDLRKRLDDITRRLDRNDPDRAAGTVTELSEKLTDLRDDGQLTTAGYDTLVPGLDRLAAALPHDEPSPN